MEFVKTVPISAVRAISERVAEVNRTQPYGQNRDVLNGTVGEPTHAVEFQVTDVMERTIEASRGKAMGYTSFFGAPEYRERIAKVIDKEYRALDDGTAPGYKTENVLMTAGASSGLQAAMFGLANEQVPVLTPAPYYLLYKNQADLARAELIPMDVSGSNYKITPEILSAHLENLRAKQGVEAKDLRANVLFDYPGNPIGTMLNKEEWQGIAQVLRQYPRVNIMMDEIYRDVIVTQDAKGTPKPYVSLLHVAPDLKDRTIMFFSGSKGPALAGERIGCAVGPKEAIDTLATIQFPFLVHPSKTAQAGFAKATEMLAEPALRKKISDFYKERIDTVKNGLKGLTINAEIDGAFYVVADLKGMIGKPFSEKAREVVRQNPQNFAGLDTDTIQNDRQIALQLLYEHGAAVTPGSGFGYKPEEGKVRIACTSTPAQLRALTEEINAALGRPRPAPAPAQPQKPQDFITMMVSWLMGEKNPAVIR